MQAVEVIRFRVSAEHAPQFLERRAQVDEALKSLGGFVSAELLQVSADEWLALVRWNSRDDATAAQAITRDMPIISEWIALADQFLAFETVDVRYSYTNA